MKRSTRLILYTIGHSNRPIGQFLDLLKAHGVKKVVDIRTIPKSRHNPQFNQAPLRSALKRSRIGYLWLKDLGGLRHAKKDSVNLGWYNLSFRGFADYMGSPEFAEGLARLEKLASQRKTAIMCAEALPWQCHRSLIADALTKAHWQVFHIQSKKVAKQHGLTPFLKMRQGKIVYPQF